MTTIHLLELRWHGLYLDVMTRGKSVRAEKTVIIEGEES